MVKIYILLDPRSKQIRYVGKTVKSLSKRLSQHLYSARNQGITHKDKWIRSLRIQNLKPQIVLLEEVNLTQWQDREVFWIRELGKTCNLTNHDGGGKDGCSNSGMKHFKVVYSTNEVRQAVTLYVLGCSFQQITSLSPFEHLKLKTLRGWAEKEVRTAETYGIPMKSEYKREHLALLQ